MTQPAARRDEDDRRLPAVVNVLWAAGEAIPDAVVDRAFAMIVEAARLGAARWSSLYRPTALVRLLYAPQTPPSRTVLAAAERAGMIGRPYEGGDRIAAIEGDVALLAGRMFDAISPTTLALVVGDELRLADVDPHLPTVDGETPSRSDVAATPEALAEALMGPPRGVAERRKLVEYLHEDARASALRFEYEILLRLIGERPPAAGPPDDAWDRALALNRAASVDRGETIALLRAEYERADALALAYGRRWRSTLAARSFLLFAANLLSGLIGSLIPTLSIVTLPIQFLVTALIYLDQHVSGRRRWRGKWIDYRRAAEAARIARFCALAGAPVAEPTKASWIDWRLARLLRGAEPAPPMSQADAVRFLAYLSEVEVDRQIAYHRASFRRFRRLNTRLRRAALATLLATIVLGAGLAVVAAAGVSSRQIPLLGAVGLALSAGPGLFAALNGLRSQLDVERQAARSARIGLALRRFRRALAGATPSEALARAAASRAAEIMHDDIASWDRVMEIV